MDEYTHSLLRPDNYELFDKVRDRLNARPVEPIECIARDVGVSVDHLCRWVIGFREKGRPKAPYQSPKFAALAQPRKNGGGGDWGQSENIRRMKAWSKAREGARAAREAMNDA